MSVGDPLCQRVAPLAVAVLLINVVLVVLTVGEVKIISSAGERGRTVPSCGTKILLTPPGQKKTVMRPNIFHTGPYKSSSQ